MKNLQQNICYLVTQPDLTELAEKLLPGNPNPECHMLPSCSVIICTKDRPRDLDLTLNSLLTQTHPPDFLIVVDDGKDEDTQELLKSHSLTRVVTTLYLRSLLPHTGLPSARNDGIRHLPANAEIVLFLDDDVTLENEYVYNLCKFFARNPQLSGVSGYITNGYNNRSFPEKMLLALIGLVNPVLVPAALFTPCVTHTAEAMGPLFRKGGKTHVPAQWLCGCNMAYRAAVFSEGWRFDEKLVRYALGEDLIFSHILHLHGKKLALVYNTKIQHRKSPVGRLPSGSALVMKQGYRRYAQMVFTGRSRLESCYFALFIIELFAASILLSLRYRKNLSYFWETVQSFRTVRPLLTDIESGSLETLNKLL
jgi:glycosyltransferase involved in cell wall biosynthesis